MINYDHILDSEARLLMATETSDVLELDRLLHEKLLFTDQYGRLITKSMDLDVHRSGRLRIHFLRVKEHKINLISDIAVVSALIHLQGFFLDQAFDGMFRYTRIWQNTHGNWQVIAGSCVTQS